MDLLPNYLTTHLPNSPVDRRDADVVGRHARLELTFEYRAGRTVVTRAYAEPPLRIGRSFDLDGAAYVILVCAGPGVFSGDCLRQHVSVGRGARVLLASQAALQVHPSPAPAAATVQHEYRVDEEGELLCQWDPVIPFADARLVQRVDVDLATSSRFYWSDGLMSGRVSCGEAWRFESIDHELRVAVCGAPGYLERYRLVPAERKPRRQWLAGPADYLGTTVVRHGGVTPRFVDELQTRFADPSAAVDLVDARLGLMVGRFLAASGTTWQRERTTCRDVVLDSLFALPARSFRR